MPVRTSRAPCASERSAAAASGGSVGRTSIARAVARARTRPLRTARSTCTAAIASAAIASRVCHQTGAMRAVSYEISIAFFSAASRLSSPWLRSSASRAAGASCRSSATARSSSSSARPSNTGPRAASATRTGCRGITTTTSSPTAPPTSASTIRAGPRPPPPKATRRIAEEADWLIRSARPPASVAPTIAITTTTEICHAPLPISDTSRSPTAMPNATPSVSSTARRLRRPGASPSAMVAEMGAKNGVWWPIRSCATNQAAPAATAHWRIGIAAARTASTRLMTGGGSGGVIARIAPIMADPPVSDSLRAAADQPLAGRAHQRAGALHLGVHERERIGAEQQQRHFAIGADRHRSCRQLARLDRLPVGERRPRGARRRNHPLAGAQRPPGHAGLVRGDRRQAAGHRGDRRQPLAVRGREQHAAVGADHREQGRQQRRPRRAGIAGADGASERLRHRDAGIRQVDRAALPEQLHLRLERRQRAAEVAALDEQVVDRLAVAVADHLHREDVGAAPRQAARHQRQAAGAVGEGEADQVAVVRHRAPKTAKAPEDSGASSPPCGRRRPLFERSSWCYGRSRMTVVLDLDGVLTEHPRVLAAAASARFGIDLPERAFIDAAGLEIPDEVRAWVYSDEGPASVLQPADEAAGLVARLVAVADVCVVTARSAACAAMTRAWLERHGFGELEIRFADDKPAVARSLRAACAIEDSERHARVYAATGIPCLLLGEGPPIDGVTRVASLAEAVAAAAELAPERGDGSAPASLQAAAAAGRLLAALAPSFDRLQVTVNGLVPAAELREVVEVVLAEALA